MAVSKNTPAASLDEIESAIRDADEEARKAIEAIQAAKAEKLQKLNAEVARIKQGKIEEIRALIEASKLSADEIASAIFPEFSRKAAGGSSGGSSKSIFPFPAGTTFSNGSEEWIFTGGRGNKRPEWVKAALEAGTLGSLVKGTLVHSGESAPAEGT